MTLPISPNSISLDQVNTELVITSGTRIALNDTPVRTLFVKPTGTISLSDGYGKSYDFIPAPITADVQNLNLRTWALSQGWDGTRRVIVTINSGVTIGSNNTSSAALTIDGTWPRGVKLINNGLIIGCGGKGGNNDTNGSPGGTALLVSTATDIENTFGTIGGGGGGGGGGASGSYTVSGKYGDTVYYYTGAGGGGGQGYLPGAGGTGVPNGSPGTKNAGGTGGNGAGSGGGLGAAGSLGGGAGGPAVSGNAYVNWISTGNRLGALV